MYVKSKLSSQQKTQLLLHNQAYTYITALRKRELKTVRYDLCPNG